MAIAVGSVAAALIVRSNDSADFHRMQREEALRSARQAEAVAGLSVGELANAAAFFQAEGSFGKHEFDVIAKPLLQRGALSGTAFIQRVPASRRAAFERRNQAPIFELTPSGPRRTGPQSVYYPVLFGLSSIGAATPVGYNLAGDPERGPFLRRARDLGRSVATPPVRLLIGGVGINVYRPVYRDGAPTRTVEQRRAALVGFAAGAFRVKDLAAAAISSVPDEVEVQIRVAPNDVIGAPGVLEDAARAPIHIADRTWLLIVRDPNRPEALLPILLAVVGIALAALLGVLIVLWSRNERIQELKRQASQDELTGLKNRRRFEEELRAAMARSRRDGTTGAVLMLDLDNFKQVNDSLGHQAGDRMIEEIAEVLRRRSRTSDVLARLGGDEFALVLPRSDEARARAAAEAIAEAVRKHRPEHEGLEPITASIGVAMFGDDPRTSLETVVSEADTAMYAAKDSGRDGVRVFDPLSVRDEAVD